MREYESGPPDCEEIASELGKETSTPETNGDPAVDQRARPVQNKGGLQPRGWLVEASGRREWSPALERRNTVGGAGKFLGQAGVGLSTVRVRICVGECLPHLLSPLLLRILE